MALQCIGSCGASRVAKTRFLEDLNDPVKTVKESEWVKNQYLYTNKRRFSDFDDTYRDIYGKNYMTPTEDTHEVSEIQDDTAFEYTRDENELETVKPRIRWVLRPCNPKELVNTAPEPFEKLLTGRAPPVLHPHNMHWVKEVDPPSRCYTRSVTDFYPSHWSNRCENSSTLTDMLSSRGPYTRRTAEKWGVAPCLPPINCRRFPPHFPDITSPMTGYVQDIYLNNRHFKMY